MTKALLTLVLIATFALLLGSSQNQSNDDLAQIRQAVADLGLRISRLEHGAGVNAGPVDASMSQPVPRSMVVGGMQTAANAPADATAVNQLQSDIDSLQQTVNYHKDNSDRIAGDYYAYGYYDGTHYGYDHSTSGRNAAEISQQHMANRYATQLAIKKEKLDKLQREAAMPHQVIHGHDGDVIFTLRTSGNLASELSSINIGDTVTWGGQRISADGNSETWVISSIKKVERK